MFDGYIRVSSVGGRDGAGSFISPEEQRQKIEAFASATGIEVRVHDPELDVSGKKMVRPMLDSIMQRIESGQSEGLIVARVNRLSRAGLPDAIKLVERIKAAGARVAFAELGNIDPTTPTGELVVNLWLSIAHMQWREYRDKFVADKKRAVTEKGWWVGPTPLGFEKRDRNDAGKLVGKLYPNDDAPKVVKLFELSATEGIHAALAYAEQAWPDRAWSTFKVRRVLANRIYKGVIRVGDYVGTMDALVDESTWLFAQHPHPKRRGKNSYPLSGIAACAACGKTLVGHTTGTEGNRHRAYRCTTKGCPLHVKADPLEQLVDAALADAPRPKERTGNEILASAQAIMVAQAELEGYIDSTSITALGKTRWQKGLEAREAVLAEAQRADEAAAQAASNDESPYAALADLKVRRGRGPLSERVSLTLA
jgi:site-specific DNA recombinase